MSRLTTLTMLVLSTALIGAPTARGDLAAWDQEKVTAIASELAQAAQELRDALAKEPVPLTMGRPGRRAFFSLREDVHLIASASQRLQRALGEGAGLDETYPIYRKILVAARSSQQELWRIPLGESVSGKLEATAEAIRRIRPFYEAEPPL